MMSERAAKDAVQSALWNMQRLNNCKAISEGMEPDLPREGDWFRVSRHAAGMASAYVVQNQLRKRFKGKLETRVVNQIDNPDVKWNAEIWVKRGEQD